MAHGAAVISLLFGCSLVESPRPKTVVLVVTDTLRADRLGVYGNTNPTTPYLDKIAKEGVYFNRAYAQSGWTLPSFVSLFTGFYPHEHRVVRSPKNIETFGSLPEERNTLAEQMSKAGYRTGAFLNNTFLAPQFGLQQGFMNYDYQGADNTNFRSAYETTELALSWLKQSEQDTFLVVHYMEPHMHLEPPKEVRGTFSEDSSLPIPFMTKHAFEYTNKPELLNSKIVSSVLNLYDEEILYTDKAIRRLVEGIKEQNRWDDTLFVFTSDHGEEFWDHGRFEHGHSLMGVLTRIPLIVSGYGVSQRGKQDVLVEHVDLFRGILEVSGAQIPSESRGESLFALLEQEDLVERWSVSENTLYGDPMISLVSPKHRVVVNQKSKTARVWSVDEHGLDLHPVPDALQSKLSKPLLSGLQGVRGDLKTINEISGFNLPSQEAFQQLKALGYLEE